MLLLDTMPLWDTVSLWDTVPLWDTMSMWDTVPLWDFMPCGIRTHSAVGYRAAWDPLSHSFHTNLALGPTPSAPRRKRRRSRCTMTAGMTGARDGCVRAGGVCGAHGGGTACGVSRCCHRPVHGGSGCTPKPLRLPSGRSCLRAPTPPMRTAQHSAATAEEPLFGGHAHDGTRRTHTHPRVVARVRTTLVARVCHSSISCRAPR